MTLRDAARQTVHTYLEHGPGSDQHRLAILTLRCHAFDPNETIRGASPSPQRAARPRARDGRR